MERKARKRNKADPEAVSRILETLPVISACNDLRALTDLEASNRFMFQVCASPSPLSPLLPPLYFPFLSFLPTSH